MALREAIGTAEPILCLWLWAAENAPDGDLGGMTTQRVEEAAGWHGKRGKAVSAMVDSGFIDVDQGGGMKLHNWTERAGAGVSNLERRRELARERMQRVRANRSRTEPEPSENTVSANKTETLSLSPDLGSSGSPSLEADPDRSKPHARIRPRTAPEFILCLKIAMEREQPERGTWNAEPFGHKNAQTFIAGFGDDLEAALETIEKRIALFARDLAMSPWTVKKFADNYNGIGQPKASRATNGQRPVFWKPQ
jgi:hypothetical protein